MFIAPTSSGSRGPPKKFPGSQKPGTGDGSTNDYQKLFAIPDDSLGDAAKAYVKSQLTQLEGILGLRIDSYTRLLEASSYNTRFSEQARTVLEGECAADVVADAARVGDMIDKIEAPNETEQGHSERDAINQTVTAMKVLNTIVTWEAQLDKSDRFRLNARKRIFAEMLRAKVEGKLKSI